MTPEKHQTPHSDIIMQHPGFLTLFLKNMSCKKVSDALF